MEKYPDWTVNQTEFVEALKHRWHGIEVKESEIYALQWSVEVEGYHPMLGGLQSDYHTVTIDGGPIASIAEFAVWYRSLVPEQHRLFLFRETTFDNPIELHKTPSKEGLATTLANY